MSKDRKSLEISVSESSKDKRDLTLQIKFYNKEEAVNLYNAFYSIGLTVELSTDNEDAFLLSFIFPINTNKAS